MPDPIDFTAKTDRELLILVAQRTNDLAGDLADFKEQMAFTNSRLRCVETRTTRLDVIWKVALVLAAGGGAGGGLWRLLS